MALTSRCGSTLQVVDAEPPRWSRVEEKSLAIHRLLAARLLSNPLTVLEKARANLTSCDVPIADTPHDFSRSGHPSSINRST